MPKIALQPLSPFLLKENIGFKRKMLFFESIWINETHLSVNIRHKDYEFKNATEEVRLLVNENLSSIEYLIEAGEIKLYKSSEKNIPKDENRLLIEVNEMRELSLVGSLIGKEGGITKKNNEYFSKITADVLLRAECAKLNLSEDAEFFPLLQSTGSFDINTKKTKVLKFLYDKIPVPSDDTSFEEIIDFKKNTDTVQKYHKLIKWANDISKSEMTKSEIIDSYNDLYSDYVKQYQNYKMKTSFKVIEVLFGLTDSLMSGVNRNLAIAGSMFKLWKEEVALIEAEAKFSGREIAYIFKAENEFK